MGAAPEHGDWGCTKKEAAMEKTRIKWAALMIDGINFAEHTVVVALGVPLSPSYSRYGVARRSRPQPRRASAATTDEAC